MAQAETATQLYAVVEAGEAALDRLTVALSAAEFASMLILPPAGGTLDAATARPLIEAAQEKNVAALIADDAQLARTLRADGVHLSATKKLADAYAEARSILGRVGIVGVDPGISRHDAMTLAEDGADYLAFGAPPHLNDRSKPRRTIYPVAGAFSSCAVTSTKSTMSAQVRKTSSVSRNASMPQRHRHDFLLIQTKAKPTSSKPHSSLCPSISKSRKAPPEPCQNPRE